MPGDEAAAIWRGEVMNLGILIGILNEEQGFKEPFGALDNGLCVRLYPVSQLVPSGPTAWVPRHLVHTAKEMGRPLPAVRRKRK